MRKRKMNKTLLGMVSIVAISIPMTASGQTEDIFPPTDGQVMEPATPGTNNQLSNSGVIPKDNTNPPDDPDGKRDIILDDNEIAFRLTMINGKMNSIYKLCGGIMGSEILNFGCDQKQWTAEVDTGRNRLGQIWVFSLHGDTGANQLYGCIIGESEKKVSCNTTSVPTPPTEQELIIDWSQRSATGIPSTFSQTPGSQSIDREDIRRQSQQQSEGNNNDDEEEDDQDEDDN
jgi:hypothetical protein